MADRGGRRAGGDRHVCCRAGRRPERRTGHADRYAVDQVAARYRALGAGLLDGTLRCAGLPTGPGQTDRVACDGGGWSLELTTYVTVDALNEVRDRALAPAPDSARSATLVEADAAFGLDQTATGASRIHWDAQAPRR